MKRLSAQQPDDIGRLFHEFARAGDLEGIGSLYEDDAILRTDGITIEGIDGIKSFYAQLLAGGTTFTQGRLHAPLVAGDLALTASLLASGATTVEVARRQSDG